MPDKVDYNKVREALRNIKEIASELFALEALIDDDSTYNDELQTKIDEKVSELDKTTALIREANNILQQDHPSTESNN